MTLAHIFNSLATKLQRFILRRTMLPTCTSAFPLLYPQECFAFSSSIRWSRTTRKNQKSRIPSGELHVCRDVQTSLLELAKRQTVLPSRNGQQRCMRARVVPNTRRRRALNAGRRLEVVGQAARSGGGRSKLCGVSWSGGEERTTKVVRTHTSRGEYGGQVS